MIIYLLITLLIITLLIGSWYVYRKKQHATSIAAGMATALMLGSIAALYPLSFAGCNFIICSSDTAVDGFDSSNMGDSYDELLDALWYPGNATRIFGPYASVPWMNSDSQCRMVAQGSGGNLKDGAACNIGTVNSQNYCMVTDEFSQVVIDTAMGNNQTRFNLLYNTTKAINSTFDRLPAWRVVVREATQSFQACLSGVNGNCDTASDATARIIIGLYTAANNDLFTNTAQKEEYRALAINFSRAMRENEYTNVCYSISPLADTQVCYWSAGGSDVANGGLGSNDFGYTGYYADNAAAQLLDCIQSGNETACYFANQTWLAYYQAAYPEGTSIASNGFRAPPGLAHKWDVTGDHPEPVCTRDCQCWDGADAPRAVSWGLVYYYAYISNKTEYFPDLDRYLATWWETHGLDSLTTFSYRVCPDGSASVSPQSGYLAQGLQAQLLISNTSSNYNTTIRNMLDHYNTATNTWDYTSCFGVYGQSIGIRAFGVGLGRDYNAWTNGTNITTTTSTTSNITIGTAILNDTSLSINGSVKLNVSVTTVSGDIINVTAEIRRPNGTKTNYSLTQLTENVTITTPSYVSTYSCDFSDAGDSCVNDFTSSTGGVDTSNNRYNLSADTFWSKNYNCEGNCSLYACFYVSQNSTNNKQYYVTTNGTLTENRFYFEQQNANNLQYDNEPGYNGKIASVPYDAWHCTNITMDFVYNTSTLLVEYPNGTDIGSKTSISFENTGSNQYWGFDFSTCDDCYMTNFSFTGGNFSDPNGWSESTTEQNTTTWELDYSSTPTNGTYNITLIWANSSIADTNSTNPLLHFNVSAGEIVNQAPTVYLLTPENDSLQNTTSTVTLTFNVTDDESTGISCSLYGNFTGSFIINDTLTGSPSGVGGSFELTLANGTYSWNVLCNDTEGANAFAPSNFTFDINFTTSPTLFNWTTNFDINHTVRMSDLDLSAENLSAYRFNSSLNPAYSQNETNACYTINNEGPSFMLQAKINQSDSGFIYSLANQSNTTGASIWNLTTTYQNLTSISALETKDLYCFASYNSTLLSYNAEVSVLFTGASS